MFRNTFKRVGVLVVALLSVLGAVVALGASPASATDANNATSCRNVLYSDGRILFAV